MPVSAAARSCVGALLLASVVACQAPEPSPPDELVFDDVTSEVGLVDWANFYPGIESFLGGVSGADYDADGWEDVLIISPEAGGSRLYRNRGYGQFEDVTERAGLAEIPGGASSGLFLDTDADADLDLLLGFVDEQAVRLYENIGGQFARAAASGLDATRMVLSMACADLDRDGGFEVFLTHWADEAGTFGRFLPSGLPVLLSFRGGGVEDVGADWGVSAELFPLGFTPNFTDLDEDERPDLLVAADDGLSRVARQREGRFEVSSEGFTDENGMGANVADFDNDGDMDWFVTSIWSSNIISDATGTSRRTGNRLYLNDGSGQLGDVSGTARVRQGYWGWGACVADFDNDGWQDIFHVNGVTFQSETTAMFLEDPAVLFLGSEGGEFREAAAAVGLDDRGQGRGLTCADYDHDGDIDVLLVNNDSGPRFMRNVGNPWNNYLSLVLHGPEGNANAVGARVTLTTDQRSQTREVRCGSNYLSQEPHALHFGVGEQRQIDTLEVVWPSGQRSVVHDLEVNQRLELRLDHTE